MIDFSICLAKCEGIDIISFNDKEVDSRRERKLSELSGFDKNPKLSRTIKKLTDQYNKYKGSFNFPTKFKSKN